MEYTFVPPPKAEYMVDVRLSEQEVMDLIFAMERASTADGPRWGRLQKTAKQFKIINDNWPTE